MESDANDNNDGVVQIVRSSPASRTTPETASQLLALQKNRKQRASAQSLEISTFAGIKQDNLGEDFDLLNAKLKLHEVADFPADYMPAVGDNVVVILQPYREFLAGFDFSSTYALTPDEVALVRSPCSSDSPLVFGKVLECKAVNLIAGSNTGNDNESIATLMTLKQKGTSKQVTLLNMPYSSPLVCSDEYLLSAERFNASLLKQYLVNGAQVRKLFAAPDTGDDANECSGNASGGGGRAIWIEGSIYSISDNLKTDPYQAIKVVWLSHEEDTSDWVFAYTQTDCNCSPWDLEPSAFISLESKNNARAKNGVLPSSLVFGNVLPENVYDFFCSQDFCDIFRYRIADMSEEYVAMFPQSEDQLDVYVIGNWLAQGRYSPVDENGARSNTLGIVTLLRDFDRMVAHAKKFNACNASFLPWRQADMAETFLSTLRSNLARKHIQMAPALLEPAAGANASTASSSSALTAELSMETEV